MKPLATVRCRRWIALSAALLVCGIAQCARAADSVRLVVDYGDGMETHFTALAWKDGLTALDALAAAKAHPHGITFSQRGSGTSAMITKIGDLENEGGKASAKNWLFSINGKMSELGAGAAKVQPGDTILWKFQAYEYNSKQ